MCRWFTLFLLPYIIFLISALEHVERNSLPRPIHPRRHKRAEQVRLPPVSRTPFVLWKNDPKCMIDGRDMMSCPKKNANDPDERLICIEPQELCDDHQDCLGGEDEAPHFCMFKKLEDAEVRRLKAEIYALAQNNNRKQEPVYKDVIVNNDETSDGTKQQVRPGVFKVNHLGPLGKSKMYKNAEYEDDVNKSEEESEEEDEDEDEDDEQEQEQIEDAETKRREHAKRRRTYRHLLQLEGVRL
ncbi:hypothetical protein GCK72_024606 [Caenorhabditis remanei]|nr:hypothetical protein GCK72_024606 [Caenorhabditis remanei]KAF1748139.1 hypothetical protein GCK72_024606 [Caenorhabditis remanei]